MPKIRYHFICFRLVHSGDGHIGLYDYFVLALCCNHGVMERRGRTNFDEALEHRILVLRDYVLNCTPWRQGLVRGFPAEVSVQGSLLFADSRGEGFAADRSLRSVGQFERPSFQCEEVSCRLR